MDSNINIDEDINDLIVNNVIDLTTYYNNLFQLNNNKTNDTTEDSENFQDSDESDDSPEYKYIYVVKLPNDQKLYYLKPEQTQYFLDNVKCEVNYIKININSIEYQNAFYNSKVNSIIKDEKQIVTNFKWPDV